MLTSDMHPYQNIHNIFQQVNDTTSIITPNRRLSATLHKLYQQYQIARNMVHWPTPDILPMTTWIKRLWDDYTSKTFTDAAIVLNPIQESFLWESIISSTKESTQLLQITETAEVAKSAWSLLKQWLIDIEQPLFKSSEDYYALYNWAASFVNINKKRGWIDSASLTDLVIEKIKTHEITPKKKIILFGFTELSPQLKRLIEVHRHNSWIATLCEERGARNNATHRISLTDTDDEILTMARWAKAVLKQNPSVRIGCVIPSLDKIRSRVIQQFSEVLNNEFYNISAGKPLLQCPIIYTAFQLLTLHKKKVSVDLFSSLLLSPFLGNAESERIKRANFDNYLRRENMTTIHFPLHKLTDYCPRLAKKIDLFLKKMESIPTEQSYYAWANVFCELLAALGWPGERSLNSEEYQIVEHWLRLLEQFTTLDQVAKPTNLHQAIQVLKKTAANSIFQPKTPDAPIQVLGLLEAAGLPFDYLWLAGMDDMSWPPSPKPNPLIPKNLQRELQMPHATAERELIYCQQLMQQFKQNASEIIFSHAKKQEELELQPSPLIRDIPEITIHQLNLEHYQSPAEKIYKSNHLQWILDEIAPAHHDNVSIRGGVNVIKQQAMCPFKAFAEMRLHARELENPLPGLRAKDRGSILHKALEILWNNLHDHATLCQQDELSLHKIIYSCIDEALGSLTHSHHDKPQYLSLEKKRLFKLLWDWLQVEKQRSPFKVLNNEKSTQMTLNHLQLTIRIDRIDELENGKKLIIDYKTGKNIDISNWFSDRPEEPQLPLYSLLDTDNTIGITFAQIFPGKHGFKGISRYALNIKGIATTAEYKKTSALSWDEQLTQWKDILTRLSDDFYMGVAKVNPKNGDETCEWCALKPLCRIKEDRYDH